MAIRAGLSASQAYCQGVCQYQWRRECQVMHRPISGENSGARDVENAVIENFVTKQHPQRIVSLTVIGTIAIWLVCAAINTLTSKYLLDVFNFPFFWTTVQFVTSFLFTQWYLTCKGLRKPIAGTVVENAAMAGFHALAFILMNISLMLVTAPFAELVRAMETMTTMLLSYLYLGERPSIKSLCTVVPVCGGMTLACRSTEGFSLTGFLLLCASNLCFSGRSVGAKALQLRYPDSADPANLFADASLYGLILLVPLTVLWEGRALYLAFGALSLDYLFHPAVAILLVGHCVIAAVCNLLSFVVLAWTDPISHSVLNVFRRVLAIIASAAYFGVTLDSRNIQGMAVSVAGVLLYMYTRFADKPA